MSIFQNIVKAIFLICAQRGYAWSQFDAVEAYLNASREEQETVYVMQPVGAEYSAFNIGTTDWVCQLKQALCGLRDSGTLWDKEL
jgi:hypothetical protein